MKTAHLLPGPLAALAAVAAGPARAANPMSYLEGFGAKAHPVVALTWGTLLIAGAVIAIVTVLLAVALWQRGLRRTDPRDVPVERPHGGLKLVAVGTGLSLIALFATNIWSLGVLAEVGNPPRTSDPTITVTGRQWFWDVTYQSSDPSRIFRTANEIHIPVGEKVRIELVSADVIHSFWIPKLGGKMDAVPGQRNVTWIEADTAGVYRGQCAEYCGSNHANMRLRVVAEPRDAFEAWRKNQLSDAAPSDESGAVAFATKCGACHTVRGTRARGRMGPDLSHLMTRRTIAAGVLPNDPGHLSAWISNPQAIKPGSLMPVLDIDGPELARIRDFLTSLN